MTCQRKVILKFERKKFPKLFTIFCCSIFAIVNKCKNAINHSNSNSLCVLSTAAATSTTTATAASTPPPSPSSFGNYPLTHHHHKEHLPRHSRIGIPIPRSTPKNVAAAMSLWLARRCSNLICSALCTPRSLATSFRASSR